MPDLSPDIHHARLLSALDALILEKYGSFKEAEQATGTRCITLGQWRRGKRRPSLHRLLATLDQLDIDLLDVVREAGLHPELLDDPAQQLHAVLPRREPRESVLTAMLERFVACPAQPGSVREIPDRFLELELLLDQDPKIARVEWQEAAAVAQTPAERFTALCLWAMWLNSRSHCADAGLAVAFAFRLAAPASPAYFLLLTTSASITKNLRAFEIAKPHAEQSVLGFLRRGDLENGARGLLRLGVVLWALKDHAGSDRAFRDAVALSPGSRFASMCLFNMVYNDLAEDRIDRARRHIEIHQESLAAVPPAYALRMHWLSAKVLERSGRPAAACGELCAALEHTDLSLEDPQIVFQMFFEAAELAARLGRIHELRPFVPKLKPLLALGDDSARFVGVGRAFLRLLRASGLEGPSPEDVQAYARRFAEAVAEG